MLWRSPVGTVALYGALSVHGGLALWLLYQRRTLRMPAWEATQYGLGLAIPALLATHVVGTRIAWWRLGADDPYARVVLGFWVLTPDRGVWQTVALAVVWLHACIGLHYWLRFRPRYPRVRFPLFGAALLLPVVALLGFVSAGREVANLARTPGWTHALLTATHAPRPDQSHALAAITAHFLDAYLLLLIGVVLARGVRSLRERRRAIHVAYASGRSVTVPMGYTILDASRVAGIPHASVCGGAAGVRPVACRSRRGSTRSRRPPRPSGGSCRGSGLPRTCGSRARPGRHATSPSPS